MIVAPQTEDCSTWKSIGYGFIVFVSSACLLVLEISAGRLLAPYIGVSLYTWTSIIGVILAGMALGNWLGGRLADLNSGGAVLGAVLAAAGVSSLAILFLLMLIAPWIQINVQSLLNASFLYVLLLFFMPALFLGVVTPLVVVMNLRTSSKPGRVVGRLHALAAMGSIAGTFLTGYWLVQWFGTRAIVIGAGVVLLLLAAPFLYRRVKLMAAMSGAALLVVALGIWAKGFVNPCDTETRYYCIRVVDEVVEGDALKGRSLILDHMTHSTNHPAEPALLLTPYVHAMDELVHRYFSEIAPQSAEFLFAGGGAYTHPRAVRSSLPKAQITVVELDPVVTDVARERLFVDTSGMTVFHGDARRVVARLPKNRFDVVVLDVFHDLAIPYHLAAREFFEDIKSRMRLSGLLLINVVDVFPDPQLVKSVIKTLGRSYRYVDVWMEAPPQQLSRLTYVITATEEDRLPDMVSSHRGPERTWYRLTDAISSTGAKLAQLPEITNDFAPVERLLLNLYTTPIGL